MAQNFPPNDEGDEDEDADGAGDDRAQDKPPPDEDAEGDAARGRAAFFAELGKIKERGHFAILFFGFRTAGKTWLLHRMKEQLFSVDSIICEPRFKAVQAPPGEREELPGTTQIEFHYVYAKPTFVLIDIPGEYTEHMLEWNFTELRTLLAAMDYAKAIIVAMPADVLIFGSVFPSEEGPVLEAAKPSKLKKAQQGDLLQLARDFRADNVLIRRFAEGVGHLAGLLSYVRHYGIDPSSERYADEVTADAVKDHMSTDDFMPIGGADGLDCPTFFALTKADRVLSILFRSENPTWLARDEEMLTRPESLVFKSLKLPGIRRQTELLDPWATLKTLRPQLHRQLLHNFPLAKFDYVTAFYGHDGLPSLTGDHYERHPQRGVVEILEWIRDAMRLRSRHRRLRRHYAWAVQARHYAEGIKRSRRFVFEAEPRR